MGIVLFIECTIQDTQGRQTKKTKHFETIESKGIDKIGEKKAVHTQVILCYDSGSSENNCALISSHSPPMSHR